eukprot:353778-Chlamydomonas_euryale.AAC.10
MRPPPPARRERAARVNAGTGAVQVADPARARRRRAVVHRHRAIRPRERDPCAHVAPRTVRALPPEDLALLHCPRVVLERVVVAAGLLGGRPQRLDPVVPREVVLDLWARGVGCE